MRKILFLVISLFFLSFAAPAEAAVFTDVSSDHPNYKAINYLYDNGVIQGYEDNTFRPDQKVNRAEALKIILLGSKIFVPDIQDQEIFPDVLHGTWYAKFVAKAKNLTIVRGDDSTGFFRPGDTVNLAEALKILLKTNNEQTIQPSSRPYLDVPTEAWFSPYFEFARLAYLLDESPNANVYPSTAVTRGLLAELMYRLANSTYIAADGKASYYGEKFHGKTTANGEIFDASAYTAAHRSYAFDTWLKVTNVANGKSVVVRVNDRGPYAGEDRVIDLSKAAFEKIAPLSNGIISVKLETTYAPTETPELPAKEESKVTDLLKGDLLNTTKTNCPDAASVGTIKKDTFTNIKLDEDLPNRVIQDQILTLSGTTSSNVNHVTAFLVDSSSNQSSYLGKVQNGRFSVNVRFPKVDTYNLGVIPGESGKSVIKEIKALKNTCIEEVENRNLPLVAGLTLDVIEGDTVIQWDASGYDIFKLTFSQGGLHKSYIVSDITEWRPVYREFKDFKTAEVKLSLRGANLNGQSLLEPAQIVWSPSTTEEFTASSHYEYTISEKEVSLVSLTRNSIVNSSIRAVFKPKVSIRETAAIILPTGKVKEIDLTGGTVEASDNGFGISVFPSGDYSLIATYKATTTGIHFLEINNAEGLAVINVPIYVRNQYPLLPSDRDLSDQTPVDLGTNLSSLRNQMLSLVNKDRQDFGLSTLTLDNKLNQLAQFRSDDMIANDYFGHWDKSGLDANDLRLNYGIQTLVGENLARDITVELAEYGLMRSAIHRSNILSEDWTRVGFGISQISDGSYVFVQIFSDDPLDMSDLDGLRSNILNTINEARSPNLVLTTNLNNLAQNWSDKMAAEDFFDFTDGSGTALVDTIRDAGVNASLGTYIMGNSSFADALEQLKGNAQLKESKWSDLGVGIKQDGVGIIKITLIYTE